MISKFFDQCIIKQLLVSVLVISRITKVSVRVISLSLRLRLITLTSTLIILDITKTSSNNCLLLYIVLTVSILVGQEPPGYFENSHDFVDKHDYSIICYPIISADYTVRSAHLWLKSTSA